METNSILEVEIEHLKNLKARGYDFVCSDCYLAYKEKPTKTYEDGHGGRLLEICGCGSDIFTTTEKQIDELRKRNNLVGKI